MADLDGARDRLGLARQRAEINRLSAARERLAQALPTPEPEGETEVSQGDLSVGQFATGISRGLSAGATLGFNDNIEAGFAALMEVGRGKAQFTEAYLRNLERIRDAERSFAEVAPVTSASANIVGAMAAPGTAGVGLVRQATTTAQRILLGIGLGSAGGAVAGAGAAESVEEIPDSALTGAVVGGLVGGAIPTGGAAARGVTRAVRRATSPSGRAAERVLRAAERDRITPQQIQARLAEARRMGVPMTAMDLGPNLRGQGTVINVPGKARAEFQEFLETRAQQQGERILQTARAELGETTGRALAAKADIAQRAASPLYESAFAAGKVPQTVARRFRGQLDTPIGASALRYARTHVFGDISGTKFDSMVGASPLRLIDGYKRGLDDQIGIAMRAGEQAKARAALRMKHELLRDLDRAVPGYAKARRIWSDEESFKRAIEDGRDAFRPSVAPEDFLARFREASLADKTAMRAGVGDAIEGLVNASTINRDLTSALLKPGVRRKIEIALPPQARERWRSFISMEAELPKLRTRAVEGSQTAPRLVELADVRGVLGEIAGILTTGTPGGFTLGRAAFRAGGRRMEERVGERMLEQLMTGSIPQRASGAAPAALGIEGRSIPAAAQQLIGGPAS